MYLLLTRATPETAPEVLNLEPLAPFGMLFGKPLVDFPSEIIVRVTKLTDFPDFWWFGAYLMVSNRVCPLLQELGETRFEVFPVTFVDQNGIMDPHSMEIINLLDNISCLNAAESEYVTDEDGFIEQFSHLVLNEETIPTNRHLFRLDVKETILLISDLLAERFEMVGITGARTLPVSKARY